MIDKIYPHLITIGNDVIFSANVTLLAHDAGLRNTMGLVRIGRVDIGNRVFIGLGTTVLPNVSIGDDVIIGAGSVVSKSIPNGSVAAGVPARVLCSLSDYHKRITELSQYAPVYENNVDPLNMSDEDKALQKKALSGTIGLKKAMNYHLFNSLE